MDKKVFIIAEAGVNHNGSLKSAFQMIDAAREAGANAVKFQTFQADKMVSAYAEKAEYQKLHTGSEENQYAMIKKLEFDRKAHEEMSQYCKKKNIVFLSSPFDMESINLLNELGLDIFKIPSGEITNLPYLRKIGGLKKRVILSTGMSDLNEIKSALFILLSCGTKKKDITVLHCNTEYPTPMEDVNLMAMLTIKD
ncbi:MAG: N-acetylneuraminate synthase family protein, partial [bacterium]|nr:N-acetylneuraminate synthase family protein [bacterium]